MDRIKKAFKKPALLFFLCVIVFDLLMLLLMSKDYYLSFLVGTYKTLIFSAILTLVSFYWLAKSVKIKFYWVVAVSIMAIPIIAWYGLIYVIVEFSTSRLPSPTGEETIVIEHRNITLGETNHFYNFYLTTPFPVVVKQLNKDLVGFMIRYDSGERADDLQALGVDKAKWTADGVIFYSKGGEIEVNFKQ